MKKENIFDKFEQKEYLLLLALQKRRTQKLDRIMQSITRLSDKGLIWFVFSFVLLLFSDTRIIGVGLILGLFVHIIFCHILLKNIVKRPRPNFDTLKEDFSKLAEDAEVNKSDVRKLKDYSFPSGHATSSWISLTLLYLFASVLFYPALLFAFLVAFSRIYLGEHYPSDVLGGIAIGISIGLVLHFILSFA